MASSGWGLKFSSVKPSDGHSGATSAATFSIALAPATLLSSSATSGNATVFFAEKAAALQLPVLSKYSAFTADKLLPRLFQFTFSHVTVSSLYSLVVLRYFSLVERTRLPL